MRHYTAEERADAVALAASVGPAKAADALGLPRRTVNYWAHKPEHSEVMRAAEATIAQRLSEAHRVALDAVLAGLADPRSRLGDRAQALRVLGEQLALAEGRATSRTESMSLAATINAGLSEEQVADVRDSIDAFLRAKDAGEAIQIIEDPLAQLDRSKIAALVAAVERRLGSGS